MPTETTPRHSTTAPRQAVAAGVGGSRSAPLSPIWVALTGLVISVGATLWQIDANQATVRNRLQQAGQTWAGDLGEQLQAVELGLLGARGVWIGAGNEAISLVLLQQYAESAAFKTRFPGLDDLGYVQHAASDGTTAPWRVYTTAGGDDAITPLAGLPTTIHQALLNAAQHNEMVGLPGRPLAGGTTALVQPGVQWLLPVYRGGTAPATSDERVNATVGWVSMSINPALFMARIHPAEAGLQVRVTDLNAPTGTAPLFESPRTLEGISTLPPQVQAWAGYGLNWQLQFEATPLFEQQVRPRPAWLVGAAGVVLSLLVSVLWQVVSRRSQQRRITLEGMSRLVEKRLDYVRTLEVREQAIVSQAQSSIVVTDATGKIVLFNPASEQLLGWRARDLVGQAHLNILFDQDEMRRRVRALSTHLGRRLEPGEVFSPGRLMGLDDRHEWQYVRADGSRVPVFLTVGRLTDEHGQLSGFVGIASDLTDRKRLERELHEANVMAERTRHAEAASEAKGQFLANMSHEIRTPLNAIIGLARLLEHTPLSHEQSSYIRKTLLASQALLDLVNDVLDLAKIESGQLEVAPTPLELGMVLDAVLSVMENQAQAKGIGLRCVTAADVPRHVCADAMRLRQVLLNLLGNAIKFTSQGEVVLSVEVQAHPDDDWLLRFAVRDTGMGIPPEVQARLFTPYTQADVGIAKRYGGTGLGLSIVKRLVALMGGKVGVHSVPDQGSEFWFTLKLHSASADEVAHATGDDGPPGQKLAGVRIVLADDSDINREVGQKLLEHEGAIVQTACNGAEACQLTLNAHPPVHVVLMDLHMPVLDGCEATRRIRSHGEFANLPIIALTGGVEASEQARAHEAGMNDHLTKPYDLPALVRTIRRHVPSAAPALESTTPATPNWPAAWNELPFVNARAVCQRLSGNLDLYSRMLHALLDDPQPLTPGEADWGHDRSDWIARWHKLRGEAGLLGLTHLHEEATEAEARFAQADTATCDAIAARLAALLAEARSTWLPLVDQALAASTTTPPPA